MWTVSFVMHSKTFKAEHQKSIPLTSANHDVDSMQGIIK